MARAWARCSASRRTSFSVKCSDPLDKEPEPDWAAYRRALGDRLRVLRVQRRLSQEGLAHEAGIGVSTLRVIEGGTPEAPRLGALFRLARVLRVPLHDLLRDQHDPERLTGRPSPGGPAPSLTPCPGRTACASASA